MSLIKRMLGRIRKPQAHFHLVVTNPSVDVRREFGKLERLDSMRRR
jgi:hypothetical protein